MKSPSGWDRQFRFLDLFRDKEGHPSLGRVIAAIPMALLIIMVLVRMIDQFQELMVGAVILSVLSIIVITFLRRHE